MHFYHPPIVFVVQHHQILITVHSLVGYAKRALVGLFPSEGVHVEKGTYCIRAEILLKLVETGAAHAGREHLCV